MLDETGITLFERPLCDNLVFRIIRAFLHFEQLRVPPIHANELVMRSGFDDAALMHDDDLIAILNGTEPMRNNDGCAVRTYAFNIVHDIGFRFTVETRRWLVA